MIRNGSRAWLWVLSLLVVLVAQPVLAQQEGEVDESIDEDAVRKAVHEKFQSERDAFDGDMNKLQRDFNSQNRQLDREAADQDKRHTGR